MAGVFINYRTGDGATAAVLLDEQLKGVFGPENVFRDRRRTAPGEHFPPHLWCALESCSVLLVLIGRNWLSQCDDTGRRRIDVPGDYVHDEIAAALKWRRTVLPVLIDGATLPTKEELPDDLAELTERQFMPLRVPYAHLDLPVITDVLRRHVPVSPEATSEPTPEPTPAPPVPPGAGPQLSGFTFGDGAAVNLGSGGATTYTGNAISHGGNATYNENGGENGGEKNGGTS
ncbi:toll/interleukin-1 receptor domain-containing protein [Streptomyces sp. NBC_01456]|uniref:toll/interleukin-1 receptor domain-containing protein n=1 Tax=unclassified Streptomyces TaxID=2593676 RepID=UPI002E2EDA27|nr:MULTISPECIES: toll/interleukin-1 receptor domain-containing protein [unclassified Streptomyces]